MLPRPGAAAGHTGGQYRRGDSGTFGPLRCSAFVAVVKTADLRNGKDRTGLGSFYRSGVRSVLLQGEMSPRLVIILQERFHGRYSEASLNTIMWSRHSRRRVPITRSTYARCQGERGADSTGSMPMSRTWLGEAIAEDPVTISQKIARGCVPRECLAELLGSPFGSVVGRDTKVQDPAALMSQHQEDI